MSCYLSIIQHRVFVGLTPREGEGCADLECFSNSDIATLNLSELLLCWYLYIKMHLRVVSAAA